MPYSIDQLRGAWGAGYQAATKKLESDPLVGLYVHTKDAEGSITYQGRIVRQMKPGVYLMQLFSWLDGRPTKQIVVQVDDMAGWDFYESAEEWRAA